MQTQVGLREAWGGLRNALWKKRTTEAEQGVAGLLAFDTIKTVYLHGHKHPELISPDNWNIDFCFMERPNARQVQMDLFYDYRTNVTLYPQWQNFLREKQPRTVIFWGQDDIFYSGRRRSLFKGFTQGRDAPAGLGALCRGGQPQRNRREHQTVFMKSMCLLV